MSSVRRDLVERYGPWAVVTGASSGIGAEFARQLAARGLSVVLVARRRDKLAALASELAAAHGVDVRVAAHDLCAAGAVEALIAQLDNLDVGLVVNNAGLGWKGAFVDQDPAEQRRMIELNCTAPVALTRALAPRLVARGRGGIVIVSSTGAFQGLPWSALYGATKAFDLLLGEALRVELRGHGVDVLTLAPGGTDTEGPMNTGVDPGKVPGKLMPVAPVVTAALAGLGRRGLVVPGAGNRAAHLAVRMVPRAVAASAAGRILRRVMKAR
ncbi:MAG TPA: SDR family NAD(P)-dependent oxidoreductase [Kofleriaceae bacterium]|nr:SDR family NAD(P)-dependent oxidoreductase [Kofleriaceae bacterium]